MGVIKKVGAGAALGAVVATAATLFLTSSPEGKKLVKDAKKGAVHLGKTVVNKAKKVKALTEKKYHAVVDEAVEEFVADKKMAKAEITKIKRELKKKWQIIKKEI